MSQRRRPRSTQNRTRLGSQRKSAWASKFVNRSKRVKKILETRLLDTTMCEMEIKWRYKEKDNELRFDIDIVDPQGRPLLYENVCKGQNLDYDNAVSEQDLATKVQAKRAAEIADRPNPEEPADMTTINRKVAVHPSVASQFNPTPNGTPARGVEIIFSIHKDRNGIIKSSLDHLLVGCWRCGGAHLINPISKQHLGTILLLAYTLICGRNIEAVRRSRLIDATGGYYDQFGWRGEDEELALNLPGRHGTRIILMRLANSIRKYGPGKYLKKEDDEDVEDLIIRVKALDGLSRNSFLGGRKTKRRKKRICCVGIGCPEWKHCIHVLGDGAKYRPKRKSTLKRMKKCGKRYTSLGKKYKKCMKRERKKTRKRRKRR